MGGFFYNLGKSVGANLRKARWVYSSLTGTEADAIRAENAVGRDLAQGFVRQAELDADPAVQQALTDIGARLARRVEGGQRQFSVRAVRTPEVNAYALPGGYVFLTRALLDFCAWDADETAFVVGHEMGHVLRFHAMDRLMANSVITAAVGRLSLGKGLLGAKAAGLMTGLLNQGYSQEQELDADGIGVRLAAAAGYDAAAATRLLARLASLAGAPAGISSYLASHPPVDLRIRNVQRLLHEDASAKRR
jgi:predicted Zn-dependent protease